MIKGHQVRAELEGAPVGAVEHSHASYRWEINSPQNAVVTLVTQNAAQLLAHGSSTSSTWGRAFHWFNPTWPVGRLLAFI
jgi:hypothetical protein